MAVKLMRRVADQETDEAIKALLSGDAQAIAAVKTKRAAKGK